MVEGTLHMTEDNSFETLFLIHSVDSVHVCIFLCKTDIWLTGYNSKLWHMNRCVLAYHHFDLETLINAFEKCTIYKNKFHQIA